jgi:serine/threonine-protein kinase RsbT
MSSQQKVTAIRSDLDIVTARTVARDIARVQGFGAIDQARIATAVSELARNIFLYAKTGDVTARTIEQNGRKGIELEFRDDGPGITDIDQAMQDGYTTSRGMGKGLPGAKRLMDDFELKTEAGMGTTIRCRKWRH